MDNLQELSNELYDDTTEATSRIAVDMMLIACSAHLIGLYPTYFPRKKQKVTSRPSTPQGDFENRERVKVYPEVDLTIDVMDPTTKTTVRVTGRADWAFGYSGRQGIAHGTFSWLWRQSGTSCFRVGKLSF